MFPSVIDVGFVVGGQYGEGAPRVGGHTVGYYSTATGSTGWQAGAQSRAIIFLYMTEDSLAKFCNSEGRSVGGDASLAWLKVGASGNVDTGTATGQVDVSVLTNAWLMTGAMLDGAKVSGLKTL